MIGVIIVLFVNKEIGVEKGEVFILSYIISK